MGSVIKNGVTAVYTRAVEALCTNVTGSLKIGLRLADKFLVGLRQGYAIARTLFKIYLETRL